MFVSCQCRCVSRVLRSTMSKFSVKSLLFSPIWIFSPINWLFLRFSFISYYFVYFFSFCDVDCLMKMWNKFPFGVLFSICASYFNFISVVGEFFSNFFNILNYFNRFTNGSRNWKMVFYLLSFISRFVWNNVVRLLALHVLETNPSPHLPCTYLLSFYFDLCVKNRSKYAIILAFVTFPLDFDWCDSPCCLFFSVFIEIFCLRFPLHH